MSSVALTEDDRRAESRYAHLGDRLTWCILSSGEEHEGWTLDESPHGLAFLAETDRLPIVGDSLKVAHGAGAIGDGFRVVRVRPRTDRIAVIGCRRCDDRSGCNGCNGGDAPGLVFPFGDGYESMLRCRSDNAEGEDERERRESCRWMTNKPVQWRPYRGRRMRSGYIVERSLNGMVIQTQRRNASDVGVRLLAADARVTEAHGFRCAVVRRRRDRGKGDVTLFTEILS